MNANISVVINTLNEELNISNALASVAPWANEIVVVDMHSTDQTVSIARQHGAKVLLHERVGYVEPARSFAVESATGPWILIIDADEMVPKELAEKLLALSKDTSAYEAYKIPRINYFFGGPIMHSGWGPNQDRQLRFFRKGCVHFSNVIHSFPLVEDGARLSSLDFENSGGIIHFNYLDLSQFTKKLDTYTSIEALQLYQSNAQTNYFRVLYLMMREFGVRYFLRQGFRDGWKGFYLALLMMFYRVLTCAKEKELSESKLNSSVTEEYLRVAHSCIAEYRESKMMDTR